MVLHRAGRLLHLMAKPAILVPRNMDSDCKESIAKLAASVGYTACGITGTEPFVEYVAEVERRMQRFPATVGLYLPLLGRAYPRARMPWARSIVVCVREYGKYVIPDRLDRYIGRTYLFDRRYGSVPDHDMPDRMRAGLKGMGLRVRTGGVPCRWAAARAGIARIGRNCFAYTERSGSWINIEAWLVDAELPPDRPTLDCPCPPDCRACTDACPTGALVEPYVMRADRCAAYLSYSAPEPIAPELWQAMGCWIYGCDACQIACPMNNGKWREESRAGWLEAVVGSLRPEVLAEMTDDFYREVVYPLFWYIPKDGADRWRRNARRALAAMSDRSSANGSPDARTQEGSATS